MINKRKIGIIVIARMQSTRFPGKALKKIGNFFSLELCLINCKKVKKINNVILATTNLKKDSILLKKFKKKYSTYAGDSKNVLKRILDVCMKYNFKDVVRVTGDCPFVSPKIIEILIKNHQKNKADMTMIQKGAVGSYGEVYNVEALKKIYKNAKNLNFSEYLPYYFFHNKNKFKCTKVNLPSSLQRNYRITLDYKKDLLMLNSIFKKTKKKASEISTKHLFDILDNNPNIAKMNFSIKLKYKRKNFEKNLIKFTKFKYA